MAKSTTAQRLKEIMEMRDLRQVDLLDMVEPLCRGCGIKIGKSALSQYLSGKVEPGQSKLALMSRALDVSEAWLMGYDVPMDKRNPAPVTDNSDGRIKELTELFLRLNENQQELIVQAIKGILSNQ